MTKKKQIGKNKVYGRPDKGQNKTDFFTLGFAHYQAGRLNEAEDCCRSVLADAPLHQDALHLLGMTRHLKGDNLNAIVFIRKAITISPENFFYHLNLGNIYFSEKNYADAGICYQKALELNPNFIPTIIHLAQNLEQSQNQEEALDYYKRALRIEPDNFLALTGLGNALLSAGMIKESISTLRRLVKVTPGNADAYYNLGGALMSFGDVRGAAMQYKKALAIRPYFVEAYYNLGLSLKKSLGQPQPLPETINFYQKALAIDGNHPIALAGLSQALFTSGRTEEAIATLHNLVKTSPDQPESYYLLATSLLRTRDIEGAIEQYKKAIELRPKYVEAHHSLGIAYEYLGRLDAAIDQYRHALKLQPSFVLSHYQLAKCQKHFHQDDDILAMENIYNSERVNPDDRMLLAYGLGKAYEDIGLYDKAFDFLEEANKQQRTTYEYSVSSDETRFEQIKMIFDQALFERLAKSGTIEEGPIFVLGMPRSGTSLVEQILASNPCIYGAGELPTLHDIIVRDQLPPTFLPDFSRRTKEQLNRVLKEMGRQYLTATNSLSKESGAKYVINKMPSNFLNIGMIKLMLPNAKVIHCKRLPMDNCLSIYKNLFEAGHKYAYNQKELGRYYRLYQNLMAHWHSVIPGFIHDINYEDLVADQETQSRKLFEFCGIPWDSRSLSFHQTSRAVATLTSSQVRRPIYTDSVKLWEKYSNRLEDLANSLNENTQQK